MIGDNLGTKICSAADALAFAAAIAALRNEVKAITASFSTEMDPLSDALGDLRKQREADLAPYQAQETALREVLAAWLAGDPDGSLKDDERVVATLARKAGKPQIHADQLPDAFKTLAPDMGKINAALARGERVPGVVVTIETNLRVL